MYRVVKNIKIQIRNNLVSSISHHIQPNRLVGDNPEREKPDQPRSQVQIHPCSPIYSNPIFKLKPTKCCQICTIKFEFAFKFDGCNKFAQNPDTGQFQGYK